VPADGPAPGIRPGAGSCASKRSQSGRRAEFGQNGRQVNFGEVINEQVGGRGAAIHDDEVRFFQRREDSVEFTPVIQIEKAGVGMKPFQRRIFVVAINRDGRDAFVLEELHEVDGEETLADTAFAMEHEVETFHVLSGLSIRTCAMRGPRLRVCGVSPALESASDSCNGRSAAGSD